MKKLVALTLALIFICSCLTACKKKPANAPVEGNTLRFSNLVEEMKSLDGQQVTVTGYMSTRLSEEKGIFYLMNVPCQSTPFIKDNSQVLTDTLAVHIKKGEILEYTDSLITVEGTLVFEDFTDVKGNSYSYRITDAVFSVSETENLSDKEKQWQKLSSSGVITQLNDMYKYLYFLCYWPETTSVVNDKKAYFTPELALYNIENEGAIYNYGYQEGYFDSITENIKTVSQTDYEDLINNVASAKALADKAFNALKNGEYSKVPEYSGIFSDGTEQYRLNDWEAIENEYNSLYESFNNRLSGWTL